MTSNNLHLESEGTSPTHSMNIELPDGLTEAEARLVLAHGGTIVAGNVTLRQTPTDE